jgi:hypothetical protein
MDTQFLQDRITATKAQIIIYEDAIAALGTEGVQSYTLDTGQSRQTVTLLDLAGLNKTLESMYNRLCTMQARLNGSGVIIGGPSW